METLPGRANYDLARLKIYGHLVSCRYRARRGWTFQNREADVQRVAVEDAREALRDHARDAASLDRKRGVFAGRAAAEVAPGHYDVAAPDPGGEGGVDVLHAVRRQFRGDRGV